MADHEGSADQRFSEMTPEREIGIALFDRMGLLINVIAKTTGNDALKLDPWPRPLSAAERVRAQRFIRHHESLVRRLLPPQ